MPEQAIERKTATICTKCGYFDYGDKCRCDMPEAIELSREVEQAIIVFAGRLDLLSDLPQNHASFVEDDIRNLARAIIAQVREEMKDGH